MNNSIKSNKLFIYLLLGLLMVSAFFMRLHSFQNSRARSIDEVVYFRMAYQIQGGLKHYHTIPYGQELRDRGRP
ncbi:MAG: hypothetical protein KC713_00310, partial [Candidatus Omnitrophica bacterium]|nr:hypothetical protein [Candidatus Omnitrophota bacterium]